MPTRADFDRLDPRFRLSDQMWQQLPQYHDWGFVVFQFEPGAQDVHPMAFDFPSRFPDWLYFPTVHVHDGERFNFAHFDHRLYLQGPACATYRDAEFGDQKSISRHSYVDGESSYVGGRSRRMPRSFATLAALESGVFDPDRPLLRLSMSGRMPNEDTWLKDDSAP